MTTISSTAGQPASPKPVGRICPRDRQPGARHRTYLERRAAIKALRELDDRELRDIGIVRSQIEAAVGGVFNPDSGASGEASRR